MSLDLVRKLNSPRASVRRRAAAALAALNAKAAGAADAEAVATAAVSKATALHAALAEVKATTDGVKVPNGTTRRIGRIVGDALAAA